MGRKSKERKRKGPNQKTKQWAEDLLPLLQDRALKELTMNDLAELVGVSKSTIYEYFAAKEEILSYVVETKITELMQGRQAVAISLQQEMDNPQPLIEFLQTVPQGISSHFLRELQTHFPPIWNQVETFLSQITQDLKLYYESGIAIGKFRPTSIELLVALDRYFISQLITDTVFLAQAGIRLEELVGEYIHLRFEGLLNPHS